MKKLNAKDEKHFTQLREEFESRKEELLNAKGLMEETVNQLRDFIEEVIEKGHEYADSRSEKWQEGEAGQRYTTWLSNWESAYDNLDISFLDVENTLETATEYLNECSAEPEEG